MTEPFGDRLSHVFRSRGRLCVGLDPHPHLLSAWNLPDTAQGVRSFGLAVLDRLGERVGVVKPQVAFFERFGAAGYSALEEVIASARSRGYLVIADAKRGDIDTSVTAYAQAWLAPGSPLESDAVTLSPFQGFDSLAPVLDVAITAAKGVFVLAVTSNPEARDLQRSVVASGPHPGETVSRTIIDDVCAFNAAQGEHVLHSVGVVIGATVSPADYGIDVCSARLSSLPVLAPGFGHQGGILRDVRNQFGTLSTGLIVQESRSLLRTGPDEFARALARRCDEVAANDE